jgi:hypothetical protein
LIVNRSRVRFARSSWTMPVTLLATISSPNMPSSGCPVTMMIANSTARIALMRVNTFPRTISRTLRLTRTGTSLVRPSARRRATSPALSPGSRTSAAPFTAAPIAGG